MKAALIGYGYWGKIIRKYIEGSNEFDLVKICSLGEMQDVKLFTNKLEDIILDSSITTVFVCTPVSTHFEICKTLLISNKHVFCEKPLVKNTEEMNALYKIAELNKLILYTDYIYTVSKSVQKIKELIQGIGKICCIEGEISQFGNFYPQDNVFEVLGVHLFSVLAFILPDFTIEKYRINIFENLNKNISNIYLLVNGNTEVFYTCSLLNVKKIRIIKVYGTCGNIVFDMMDEDATVRFQRYTVRESGCYDRLEEVKWNYDENNNLEYVIQAFSQAILQKENSLNMNISRKVNEIISIISNG